MKIRGSGWAAGAVAMGVLLLGSGCNRPKQAEPEPQVHTKKEADRAQPAANEATTKAANQQVAPTTASIGAPAPAFTLKDLDGNEVTLQQFADKTVVLEWFNPGCPFVQRSHTVGSLVDTAERHAKAGVVWLAINSGAEGKQGAGLDANANGKKKFGMDHPVLLDPTGAVGKAYGATNTPHMFIIDAEGTLVYRGAIDNSPDGEGQSPKGGTLINYVDRALADLAAGKPVSTPQTDAYGCSVKYSD